jgi:diguanylate cyclase (GGDEF)-like protein
VNAAIGAIILLVEITVFVLIQRHVLRPLLLNTRAMSAIMNGELDTVLPNSQRRNEIGDMQKAVVMLRDISRRKTALELEREHLIHNLRVASSRDHLTKLHNRRAFGERAAEQLAQAKRHDWQNALILFDLDHFKRVKDSHGHEAGDNVLMRVAQIAQSHFREADVVARYGGEEFIGLACDCNANDALHLTARVRAALEQTAISAAPGVVFSVTASFGVVSARAQDVVDTESLVRLADQALYRAKSEGRNRVVHSVFETTVRAGIARDCYRRAQTKNHLKIKCL